MLLRGSILHAIHLPASLGSTGITPLHRRRASPCSFATMDALTPARRLFASLLLWTMNTVASVRAGLSDSCTGPSDRSDSNHLTRSAVALSRYPSARRTSPRAAPRGLGFVFCQQTRRRVRPNRVHLRCRPVVHLLLLPTPPRGDAVAFGYGPENVCPARTCTSLIGYTLRRTGTGYQPVLKPL